MTVRQKNLKTGLLTVNAVNQSLAGVIIKIPQRETDGTQRPLLSHQFFALHQAIERDKTACNLRIVNAVIELWHDTEQMAKHATVVLHRLR